MNERAELERFKQAFVHADLTLADTLIPVATFKHLTTQLLWLGWQAALTFREGRLDDDGIPL